MFSFVIASLAAIASAASTSHPFVENNFDFVGNDIAAVPGSAVDKCTEPCETNPACKAFSWSGYNNGTCWLKSKRDVVVAKWGVISSGLWATQPDICQALTDIDFVGNDVGSSPATDASQCCYICSKTFNCRAYSWSNYNSGTCWLKSGRSVAVVRKGIISADAYPTDAPVLLLHWDTDYALHDITNRPASKPEDCFGICKGVSGCRAFSWSGYMGGTCWLKDGKDQEVSNAGVVSGVLF